MRQRLTDQTGTTLVEMMVGILLTAFVAVIVFSTSFVAIGAWKIGCSRTEVQQTARYALDLMTRELRYADQYILESPTRLTYRNTGLGGTRGNIYCFFLSPIDKKIYRMGIRPANSPQPVTGANVEGVNIVDLLPVAGNLFVLNGKDTVEISLSAEDRLTGETLTVRTAVHSIAAYLK